MELRYTFLTNLVKGTNAGGHKKLIATPMELEGSLAEMGDKMGIHQLFQMSRCAKLIQTYLYRVPTVAVPNIDLKGMTTVKYCFIYTLKQ